MNLTNGLISSTSVFHSIHIELWPMIAKSFLCDIHTCLRLYVEKFDLIHMRRQASFLLTFNILGKVSLS